MRVPAQLGFGEGSLLGSEKATFSIGPHGTGKGRENKLSSISSEATYSTGNVHRLAMFPWT